MTLTVWPATLSVPVRSVVAVLAVALKVTDPLPDLLALPLIDNHPVPLVAVHVQPLPVVTVVVDEPAAAGMVGEAGRAPPGSP